MPDWYPRFGDIPGVVYATPPTVNRKGLRRHDAVPEVSAYELDGKRQETLWWPTRDGGSSASPAHEHAFADTSKSASPALLKRCWEGLELPGEPSDYHFLIQGCANALWARRRDEPELLEEVERLCWLDINLIEAVPAAVQSEYGDAREYYRVMAFSTLVKLCEAEGALREALDVAERAARYGQGVAERDQLIERIHLLESEDNG